ncbi:TonB family protein [Allosphingosinicella sp.]|jgi:TonB family protein|uniref:TonB family protein n=1 Tax=Allosphingosinicella sp. TaxID=2823234 RepID=UPI002EDEE762
MAGLVLASLLAAAAPAQQPARLGQEVTIRGTTYHPQVSLYLDQPEDAQPGIYRRISLNWRARPLQAGNYPAAAFAARREGEVGLSLTIAANGRLTGCTVTRPSGEPSIDAHACLHLMRNAVFHSALDESGARRGGTVGAVMEYTLPIRVHMPMFRPGPPDGPARQPRPLEPVGPATVGIAPGTPPPPDVGGIGVTVAVGADGSVTACTLHSPTFIDSIDKRACDTVRRDMRFDPAKDSEGRAVPYRYAFWVNWPDRPR